MNFYSNKIMNSGSFESNNQISFIHHHHQQQQQQQQQMENHHHHHQISFGLFHQSTSSSSANPHDDQNFISKENGHGAYDLGELDQALFLYLDGQDPSSSIQDQRQNNYGMRPPTLNIFPSQPMHIEPSSTKANDNGLVSHQATSSSKKSSQPSMDKNEPPKVAKREANGKSPASSPEQDAPKTPDPKTLRRLAQNREAARKSRLRKKAYVQQLETSRIRLAQLEHEIQRARSQGFHVGGNILVGGDQGFQLNRTNIRSDAAVFDLEYARWQEEHHRLLCDLRNAVTEENLQEDELRLYVENCVVHYDNLMNLKGMLAKSDVFHLVSGLWKSPAERCFLWIGDFRPSELLKIIVNQIEALTENQLLGICGLQQSTQEAENALSQGLEVLNQSLSDTIIASDIALLGNNNENMGNYMGQMALAINKLSTIETFLRQADHLRHQTIHRLHQMLTTRQAARCFLAIGDYFHRLRALSSLWLARPRHE